MTNRLLPTKFKEIQGSIYAGFWHRIGALLLDFVIVYPYVLLLEYINGLSRLGFFYTLVPYLAFFLIYHVYLVKRYGGTPGKLIVGIKIVKKNADDADWQAAIMRYIITFSLLIFGVIVMISALNLIDDTTFLNLTFQGRNKYLSELNPVISKVQIWLTAIWVYSEFIVLLTNERKRSIHDFMAGTVVVKSKYLPTIRELFMKEEFINK